MTSLSTAELLPRSIRTARVLARPWPLVVSSAIVGWGVVFFAIARSWFLTFEFGRFDLGNMVQAVWSTAHGRPLEITMGVTGEQTTRLAGHVDPILALLAPFWLLAPTPMTLAAVQVGACALGALPVFWLGRRHLESEGTAALMALAYLAYPWLAWAALDVMHPVVLAIPLFLYAIWFLDSNRLGYFALFAVLACMTGELMGVTLAGLGLWFGFRSRRFRLGAGIAAFGAAWSLVCVYLVIPTAAGDTSMFYSLYDSVGGSPEGVARTLITDPLAIVSAVATRSDLVYLLALVLPLAGLAVLAPGLALVAGPQLAANSLSSLFASTDPRSHHASVIIPLLVAASLLGLARLQASRQRIVAVAALVLCAGASAALGPWPSKWGSPNPWYQSTPSPSHFDTVRTATRLIPADAPVATTNRAGSHLSARRHMFSIPNIERADWVLIDFRDPWVPLPDDRATRRRWGRNDPVLVRRLASRLERSPNWRVVYERDEVVVLRREARTME